MKIRLLIALTLSASLMLYAQDRYYYNGPQIKLSNQQFYSNFISKLDGEKGQSYQGMDCWNNVVISLQNTGIATTYTLDGSSLSKISTFKLGSYASHNHANVASFTTQFFAKTDKLPLLFVSQCYKQVVGNEKDVLYVERISNNLKSSKLVAKVVFKDTNHLFGYAVQWVVDRENGFLYGYGNTIENLDAANQHRIVKFRLPVISTKSKKVQTITLTEKDVLENYLIEDYFPHYYKQIGQGAVIKHGYLYLPIGFGTQEHPSILYVWDLAKRRMQNVIDLSKATEGELEDCAEWMGELLIQTQGALYSLRFI